MTFSKNPMDDFYKIPDILLQEGNADMLLVYFVSPEIFVTRTMKSAGIPLDRIPEEAHTLIAQNVEAFCNLAEKYGKPIIGYTYRSLQEQMARSLLDRGIPVYQDPERAARAMAALIEYHRLREKIAAISA